MSPRLSYEIMIGFPSVNIHQIGYQDTFSGFIFPPDTIKFLIRLYTVIWCCCSTLSHWMLFLRPKFRKYLSLKNITANILKLYALIDVLISTLCHLSFNHIICILIMWLKDKWHKFEIKTSINAYSFNILAVIFFNDKYFRTLWCRNNIQWDKVLQQYQITVYNCIRNLIVSGGNMNPEKKS